jgi:type III pantothenate kinase
VIAILQLKPRGSLPLGFVIFRPMNSTCVLAIDVGNSRIKAGLVATSAGAGELPAVSAAFAFSASERCPVAALTGWLATQSIRPERALVGGSNPKTVAAIVTEGSLGDYCSVIQVERPSDASIANRTLEPERDGPDRLFDAVAANRIRPVGRSAVIVDSGTATTINLVDASGAFRGGAIIAGFELVASALHERTALLPKLDVAHIGTPEAIGRDTTEALRSGLYWSLVGGVKELVARFSTSALETDGEAPIVLLTGGAGPILAPHLPNAALHPYLTLQGIALSAT